MIPKNEAPSNNDRSFARRCLIGLDQRRPFQRPNRTDPNPVPLAQMVDTTKKMKGKSQASYTCPTQLKQNVHPRDGKAKTHQRFGTGKARLDREGMFGRTRSWQNNTMTAKPHSYSHVRRFRTRRSFFQLPIASMKRPPFCQPADATKAFALLLQQSTLLLTAHSRHTKHLNALWASLSLKLAAAPTGRRREPSKGHYRVVRAWQSGGF